VEIREEAFRSFHLFASHISRETRAQQERERVRVRERERNVPGECEARAVLLISQLDGAPHVTQKSSTRINHAAR
jgi:hypothetical protein